MLTKIKKRLSESRTVTAFVSLVVVLTCGYFIFHRTVGSQAIPTTPWANAWFYDLNTKQLFVAKQTNLPPVDSPTGQTAEQTPAGVWAYVYTCTTCDDPKNQFIAWIEKLTPQAKSELHAMISSMKHGYGEINPFETLNLWDQNGRLIASTERPTLWYPSTSEEGETLRTDSLKRCGDGIEPKACPPVGQEFFPPPQDIPPPEPRPELTPAPAEAQ